VVGRAQLGRLTGGRLGSHRIMALRHHPQFNTDERQVEAIVAQENPTEQ
jgi:hypothetical protein